MFKKSGRGFKKPFCVNPACEKFLPEDQRGYPKKKTEDGEAKAEEKPAAKKTAAKKTAEKKTTAKKTTRKAKAEETK